MKKTVYLLVILISIFGCSSNNSNSNTSDDSMYFPPNDGNATWQTKSISDLGWNANAVQPLLDYLQLKNSKSFMILVNGKIVMENYLQLDVLGDYLKKASTEQKEWVQSMIDIALSTNKQEEFLSLGQRIAINSLRKMNILV